MSFIGVVGVVAQAGQGATVGGATDVSIATTSSGNYDNAVIVSMTPTGSSGEQALDANDGSGFSSGAGTIDLTFGPNYNAQLLAGSGAIVFFTKAYGRATAPTGLPIDNFTWELNAASNSISTTDGSTPIAVQSFSGSGSTGDGLSGVEDATGNTGVGKKVGLIHQSGGRGYFLMSIGDHIQWKCQFEVEANGITVNASAVTIKIEVV